jgi:hypothetical protein
MAYSEAWVTESIGALRISRAVSVIAGCGLVVALALGLAALMRDRPVAATWLLILAVPAVALGQLWGLLVLSARRPLDARRTWFGISVRSTGRGVGSREFFFDGLPSWQGRALLVLAGLAVVSAMTAFPGLIRGGPTSGTPGCPYPLNNHGAYTCVSRGAYEHAGADSQRFGCGILAAFFTIQLGIASAELARRRRPAVE